MDARILKLKTPEECDVFRKNAIERGNRELAMEARKRKVQIKAENYGELTEVERECIEAVYAYEEVLSEKRGRTQPASRTWPMIAKYGVIETVERVVNREADAIGYTTLVDMGLKEYAFEAVILRHPEAFSTEAVEHSKQRMNEQSNVISTTSENNDWSDDELLASVEAYVDMQRKERASQTFTKSSYYKALSEKFNRSTKAFEYRMQNISYVLSLMGRDWLPGLKPAKNVGTKNAVKIESMLNKLEGINTIPVVEFEIAAFEATQKPLPTPPVGNPTPTSYTASVTQYSRDFAVKAWVLKRANGRCECCNKDAPFSRADGQPYLEVHHVRQMADKGADTISNAVALCPSCHREIHYGINSKLLVTKLYSTLSHLIRI